MQTVILVGTDHRFQRPGDGEPNGGGAWFPIVLANLVQHYNIAAIAEEMSVEALKHHGCLKSVPFEVAELLGITHQYSDPTASERVTLNIPQENDIRADYLSDRRTFDEIEADVVKRQNEADRAREREWLKRIRELNKWPLLFICGANHFTPFADLLKLNCFLLVKAYPDWAPP